MSEVEMKPKESPGMVYIRQIQSLSKTNQEALLGLGYPPALVKACSDHFSYAMRVRTGELFMFCDAEVINADWVMLKDFADYSNDGYAPVRDNLKINFDRGVEVRVSDIVWVADAPCGS